MTNKQFPAKCLLTLMSVVVLVSFVLIVPVSNISSQAATDIALGIDIIEEDIDAEILDGALEELAILIQAEAGNQDYRGQLLVGEVVMNRLKDPRFPNNIHDIIFQEYQFSCVKDGGYDKACWNVNEDNFRASREAWDNYISGNLSTDAIYFNSGSYCMNGKFLFKHGDHYFAK